jgi:hypothetical protein
MDGQLLIIPKLLKMLQDLSNFHRVFWFLVEEKLGIDFLLPRRNMSKKVPVVENIEQ